MYLPSRFIDLVASFSNSCDSTSFQIFLYLETHSFVSETLNNVVLAEFLSYRDTP